MGCPGAPGGCELPPREVGSLPISRWPWRSLESVGTSDLQGQGEGHTALQQGPLEVMGGKGRQLRDAHPHVCISAGDRIGNRVRKAQAAGDKRQDLGKAQRTTQQPTVHLTMLKMGNLTYIFSRN